MSLLKEKSNISKLKRRITNDSEIGNAKNGTISISLPFEGH